MTDLLNQDSTAENQKGMTISIFLPYRAYCEVEEWCQRQGITFDKYFLTLHESRAKGIPKESEWKAPTLEVQETEELRDKIEKKLKKK